MTDNTGLSNTNYAELTVTSVNSPPVFTIISPTDSSLLVYVGDSAEFAVEATDPDGDPVNYSWALAEVPVGSGDSYAYAPASGEVGIHLLVVTASDGNALSPDLFHSWTLLVQEPNQPPMITCPVDITIDCAASTDPANTGMATATDENDPDPAITYADQEVPGDCPHEKVISRTWTATDLGDSSAQCVQVITVEDVTAPVFNQTCPSDLTVECDAVPPAVTLTATDNCDPASEVTLNEATIPGPCEHSYMLTRTWTATDDCGNVSACMQTITVVDTTPPAIVCPAAVTVPCGASTDPSQTGMATAEDTCDPAPVVTYLDGPVVADSFTRTWTATDDCGNSAECFQVITIAADNESPVFDQPCPGDITVGCDGVPAAASLTATDNCDPNPVVSYTEEITPGSCSGEYTISRTWTATDNAGNSRVCIQTIGVVDTQSPVFNQTCPSDLTVECDAVPPAVTLTATDNCDPASEVTLNEATIPGPCEHSYMLTRTWTATDDCGNVSACMQTITVVDTTPPAIVCPAAVTVPCGASTDPSQTGMATAEDTCDPAPVVTYLDGPVVADSFTRTWTATDACGNEAGCDQTITITVCPSGVDIALAPEDISFSKRAPQPGDNITVSAFIRCDTASDPVSDILVRFYDGDPSIAAHQIDGDQIIPAMVAGDVVSVTVPYVVGDTLPRKIYVRVDPSDDIEEYNEDNNEAFKDIPAVMPVAVDIKPGSCPNPLNIKPFKINEFIDETEQPVFSKGGIETVRGVLPAAILGTVDFDVMDVDPTTVMLEGVAVLRSNIEDVSMPMDEAAEECECTTEGPDGFADLTLKFEKKAVIEALGEVHDGEIIPLTITGELYDGTPIMGVDCVVIRGHYSPNSEQPDTLSPWVPVASLSNYPNPFNASTVISYMLREGGSVKLEVYDVLGRRTKTLVDGIQVAGRHEVIWDGTDRHGQPVGSGIYFYCLTAGDRAQIRKMVLTK